MGTLTRRSTTSHQKVAELLSDLKAWPRIVVGTPFGAAARPQQTRSPNR